MRRLQAELRELRAIAAAEAPSKEEAVWFPAPPPEEPRPPVERKPLPRPVPREFRMPGKPPIDGARAMAIAGGLVTVLGIVFFFALAVNRGWLGASARVALGGVASCLVFAAGAWLRRRFGETHSALAAAGAGLAGAYGTVAFAAVRYDLLPDEAALVAAGVVALAGVAFSLLWSSQLMAAFAFVGAILMPVLLAVDSGLTTTGLVFVEIVLAAAAAVAIARRWHGLLAASALAALPQIAAAVAFGEASVRLDLAAAAFSATLLAAGLALQLRSREAIDAIATPYVLGAAAFAALATPALFDTSQARGFALLSVAVVYGALAAALLRRRDTASLLGAIGLAIGAIAAATLLSDQTLSMTWAAEAVVLAWLARRLGEPRFLIGCGAYLALAVAHVLAIDAPPHDLFERVSHPASGTPSLLVVAGGAALVAALLRAGEVPAWQVSAALVPAFAAYAASLGILALPVTFDWGHVAVDGAWSLVAVGLIVAGQMLGVARVRDGGFAVAAGVLAKALAFDLRELAGDPRFYALLVAGGAVLAAGYLVGSSAQLLGAISVPVSAAVLATGAVTLVHGQWDGAVLAGLAVAYAALAAPHFREGRRDLSALYWAAAVALGLPAAALLVTGAPLVLVWAGAGAAVAVLARRLGESRLELASLAFVATALAYALDLGSPRHLFAAGEHPGTGVPALLAACAGIAVLAWAATRGRTAALWGVGVVATYTASLAILELFQLGGGDVTTHFQRGHTGVSTFWGGLGLTLLYFGLTRHAAFRLAGLALFGASLAKIFLYDLAFLSSVARALSFLAVGAVLLLGGFFYQRLAARPEERPVA